MLTDVHSGQPARRVDAGGVGVGGVDASGRVGRRAVLVGGGPATASVLVTLAERAAAGVPVPGGWRPTEITVVDRAGECGGGDPHAAGVSPALLLNDKLDDIDATGIGFSRWLHEHRSRWIGRLLDAADGRVTRWLHGNRDALARTDFGGLYLPRCVFGDFIRERFAWAQRELARHDVRVRVVAEEAVAVRPDGRGGWRVSVTGPPGPMRDPTPLRADAVLLGLGSLSPPAPPGLAPHPRYFSYAAGRDLGGTLVRLAAALAWRPRHASAVAVLGSSAAASEMLFCLEEVLLLAGARTHLVVVSPSGRLADGLPSGALKPFQCRHLPALLAGSASEPLTAAALVEAVAADVALGRDQGYSIVDMLPAVNPLFGEVFPRLSPAEKRQFVEERYVRYRELVRHTPPDYAAAAGRLTAAGILTCLAGRVSRVGPGDDGALEVHVEGRARPLDAAAVFDCRGFTGVRDTANPLVRELLRSGVAAPNACGRGLRVNERFEAAPGLFVLGPALAGTSAGSTHIWSLENIPRIHALAGGVATDLWTTIAAQATSGRS